MNVIDLKDIPLARKCLNFKGYYCDDKDCLNKRCPLNKFWEGKKE